MGTWATIDGAGKVIGIQLGEQPPVPEPDASVVKIPEIESGLVVSLYNSGRTVEIDELEIKVDGVAVGHLAAA